jgi:hypothetical protein
MKNRKFIGEKNDQKKECFYDKNGRLFKVGDYVKAYEGSLVWEITKLDCSEGKLMAWLYNDVLVEGYCSLDVLSFVLNG